VRYQHVFQLTAQTLEPYAGLTFPSLAPGSRRLASLSGELLAVSAMAGGTMVGLAIAERSAQHPAQAAVCSLMVAPEWRRQGIGARLLRHLERFVVQQGAQALALRYHTSAARPSPVEPLLAHLGWPAPRTDFVLLQSSAERLAGTGWNTRFPIAAPYALFAWADATAADLAAALSLGAPPELLPPPPHAAGLEPAVSLGLRWRGALVGWLIAHRVDARTVRYSSLYVAPAHRSRARGPALAAEGFARQRTAGIPQAKAAVQVGNAAAWPTFERRMQAYFPVVGQARSARVELSSAATPVGS